MLALAMLRMRCRCWEELRRIRFRMRVSLAIAVSVGVHRPSRLFALPFCLHLVISVAPADHRRLFIRAAQGWRSRAPSRLGKLLISLHPLFLTVSKSYPVQIGGQYPKQGYH